jgi:hypothetical protein
MQRRGFLSSRSTRLTRAEDARMQRPGTLASTHLHEGWPTEQLSARRRVAVARNRFGVCCVHGIGALGSSPRCTRVCLFSKPPTLHQAEAPNMQQGCTQKLDSFGACWSLRRTRLGKV